MLFKGKSRPFGQKDDSQAWMLRQYSCVVQKVRTFRNWGLRGFKTRSAALKGHQKYWSPVTLSRPLLLCLIGFPLALAVALEALARKDKAQGGLAFAEQNFSILVSFTFLYLPTILAVFYSMVWTWVDLDTKRLEPYFQMSRREGALPKHSLHLHYPFDLLFGLPVKAIRQKQWIVALASTISIINFCGFTPVIGSVFELRKVSRQVLGEIVTTAEIQPIANQSLVNTGFLLNTYSILWLNQEPAPFTTSNGSIIPFKIALQSQEFDWSDSWKAPTDMYSSALRCSPAKVTNGSEGIVYSNGKGCSVPDWKISLLIPNEFSLFASMFSACGETNSTSDYIAFSFMNSESLPHIQPDIQGMNDVNISGGYATQWAAYQQKTVLFCQPSYQVQKVNVTLTPTMALSDIEPVSPPSRLPADFLDTSMLQYLTFFNLTMEDIFLNHSSTGIHFLPGDINETTLQIDSARLDELGITDISGGNMMNFAVGCSQLEASSYLEAGTLAESLDCAYRTIFSVAFCSLLLKVAPKYTGIPGVAMKDFNAIVMVHPLTIVLQIVLYLITALSIMVLAMSWRRTNEMVKDPASLSDVLDLVHAGESVTTSHYSYQNFGDTYNAKLRRGKLSLKSTIDGCSLSSDNISKGPKRPKRIVPSPMSTSMGITLSSILLAALLIILTILLLSWKRKGLELPSQSSVVNQIVLNYVPVTFATLLEPIWTWLIKKLCLMKPLDNLLTGPIRASQSMDLKYTSIPPQMTIWRALKARHFLLAAACGVGLSANILAVTLNNLFYVSTGNVEITQKFMRTLLPIMGSNLFNASGSDYIYVVVANISHHAPLPAWVTQDRYLLPFEIRNESLRQQLRSYESKTTAVGLNVTCSQYKEGDAGFFSLGANNTSPTIRYIGTENTCSTQWEIYFDCEGKSNASVELMGPLSPFLPTDVTEHDIHGCGSILAVGFDRTTSTTGCEIEEVAFNSSTWMICKSTIVGETYNVRVNASDKVEQIERYPLEPSPITYTNNNSQSSVLSSLFTAFDTQFNNNSWHNNTFELSWPGFLIKALTNSESFVDPSLPPPNFDQVRPVIEDLVQRLFPLMLSLQPSVFTKASPSDTVSGKILMQSTRVFVSWPMAIITIVLLLLNIAVAVMYYVHRPTPIPTGTPETIASLLELFEGSGLVQERPQSGVWPSNWLFGYGKFISVSDGKPKVGIERKPFLLV